MDNLKEKIQEVLEAYIPKYKLNQNIDYEYISNEIYIVAETEFNRDMQVVLGDLRRIRESIK
jgi:proteasome assembly chaperone (PAC2) family protein